MEAAEFHPAHDKNEMYAQPTQGKRLKVAVGENAAMETPYM